MLTAQQYTKLDAACKLLSRSIKFIPGVSYQEFVHDVLLDLSVKTVKQGIKAFRKLFNRELNNVRTSGMDEDRLKERIKKSTALTREKIATNPAYHISHNANCSRWEKTQRSKKTKYDANRKNTKRKVRKEYKLRKDSKEGIHCDIINGKCNRMTHKKHQTHSTECKMKDKFLLKHGTCYPLPYTGFRLSDIVYKLPEGNAGL